MSQFNVKGQIQCVSASCKRNQTRSLVKTLANLESWYALNAHRRRFRSQSSMAKLAAYLVGCFNDNDDDADDSSMDIVYNECC